MAVPPSVGSTSKLAHSDQPPKAKKPKKSKKGKEKAADQNLEINGTGLGHTERHEDVEMSDFKLIQNCMRVPLAPVFAEDPLEGVRQCLESWILR